MKTLTLFLILAIHVLFGNVLSVAQINPVSNFIGLDISTQPQNSGFNYDSCFTLGKKLGMSRVGLYQNWTAIETAPFTYNLAVLDIANLYYPAYNMAVDLTLTPIHTNKLEVPSDLRTKAFDSPEMISRFNRLLDSVRKHLPKLTLASLVIGSEHDVYLGSNTVLWSQYATFYKAVTAHAKALWPGLKVATELTFNGIISQNASAQLLNAESDYIGVSYYPLNSNFTVKPVSAIPADIASLVSLYPSKPLCFYQYGYPSSEVCQSSEAMQAKFIAQTFTTWDTYASHIRMIDFTWLHDLDTNVVRFYRDYYGLTDPFFLEYLRSLGLRTWKDNGTNKEAFLQLQCEARKRGYNNLAIACNNVLGLDESSAKQNMLIFPNPAYSYVEGELAYPVRNGELKLINCSGQLCKTFSGWNGSTFRIETGDLSKGVYLMELTGDNTPRIHSVLLVK